MDKIQNIISRSKAYLKSHKRFTRIGIACTVILLVFLSVSWRFGISPITPPDPSFFSSESIHKGELIANAGFCASCHTRQDGLKGEPLAGDFKIKTPLGNFYSSNITPDPEYGIGQWSKPAFVRAMRSGVSRNGKQLFPVFPFNHFTHISDEDLSDLYAYLMSRPAVHTKPRSNSVIFPFNIRLFQGVWKLLFLRKDSLHDHPDKSTAWNRGQYLAEGVSHCGTCHTPRNVFGAEKVNSPYAGSYVDGWIAPALNSDNPAPLSWTKEDLFNYLSSGYSPNHGVSAEKMGKLIHKFYVNISAQDQEAVAEYFADKMENKKTVAKLSNVTPTTTNPMRVDQTLFENSCASCHNTVKAPLPGHHNLSYSTALWLDEPTNLLQILLRGIGAHDGIDGIVMPSFYTAMSDTELVQVASYLRRTYTAAPAWPNLIDSIKSVRASILPPPLISSSN